RGASGACSSRDARSSRRGLACGRLNPPVAIFQPDDIILAKVGPALHLDKDEGDPAGVLDLVNRAKRKERAFVFADEKFPVVARHEPRTLDHDPMLGPMV